jgi:hypothetical protein
MAVAGSWHTLILPELMAYAGGGVHGAKHPPSADVMKFNISPLEVLLEFVAC